MRNLLLDQKRILLSTEYTKNRKSGISKGVPTKRKLTVRGTNIFPTMRQTSMRIQMVWTLIRVTKRSLQSRISQMARRYIQTRSIPMMRVKLKPRVSRFEGKTAIILFAITYSWSSLQHSLTYILIGDR